MTYLLDTHYMLWAIAGKLDLILNCLSAEDSSTYHKLKATYHSREVGRFEV
jgi:hypothetical protein